MDGNVITVPVVKDVVASDFKVKLDLCRVEHDLSHKEHEYIKPALAGISMCAKGRALRANHRQSEEQANRTSATSDAQEQRGKQAEAGEKGGNDARQTRQKTH